MGPYWRYGRLVEGEHLDKIADKRTAGLVEHEDVVIGIDCLCTSIHHHIYTFLRR